MRHNTFGSLMIGGWIAVFPLAAHADYLSSARDSLRNGDLKAGADRPAQRGSIRPAERRGALLVGQGRDGTWRSGCRRTRSDGRARSRLRSPCPRFLSSRRLCWHRTNSMKCYESFGRMVRTRRWMPLSSWPVATPRSGCEIRKRRRRRLWTPKTLRQTRSSRCSRMPRLAVARADLTRAQQKIDRAIAAQPKSPEALLAKSQLLRLRNDVPGAMAVLDELIP